MDGARNQHGYSTGNTNKINKNNSTKISPTYQPGISLWGSISISLGSWFGLGLPLAVVAEVVAVVAVVAEMVAVPVDSVVRVGVSLGVGSRGGGGEQAESGNSLKKEILRSLGFQLIS